MISMITFSDFRILSQICLTGKIWCETDSLKAEAVDGMRGNRFQILPRDWMCGQGVVVRGQAKNAFTPVHLTAATRRMILFAQKVTKNPLFQSENDSGLTCISISSSGLV